MGSKNESLDGRKDSEAAILRPAVRATTGPARQQLHLSTLHACCVNRTRGGWDSPKATQCGTRVYACTALANTEEHIPTSFPTHPLSPFTSWQADRQQAPVRSSGGGALLSASAAIFLITTLSQQQQAGGKEGGRRGLCRRPPCSAHLHKRARPTAAGGRRRHLPPSHGDARHVAASAAGTTGTCCRCCRSHPTTATAHARRGITVAPCRVGRGGARGGPACGRRGAAHGGISHGRGTGGGGKHGAFANGDSGARGRRWSGGASSCRGRRAATPHQPRRRQRHLARPLLHNPLELPTPTAKRRRPSGFEGVGQRSASVAWCPPPLIREVRKGSAPGSNTHPAGWPSLGGSTLGTLSNAHAVRKYPQRRDARRPENFLYRFHRELNHNGVHMHATVTPRGFGGRAARGLAPCAGRPGRAKSVNVAAAVRSRGSKQVVVSKTLRAKPAAAGAVAKTLAELLDLAEERAKSDKACGIVSMTYVRDQWEDGVFHCYER
eukprot:365810-Chlamydomonas_euryale.AAC.8